MSKYTIQLSGSGEKWDLINALRTIVQEMGEIPGDQLTLQGYTYEDENVSAEVDEEVN